ncbi:hemoglobin subunit beta [Pelobates cultripes]|uniref:Hemoglobin subunit beta n=1 Tax=Pelobates cultripes TaxID=61616 RepID=A0AAD1S244_PELCU|nr:hemoglobin subunit beta [Pelobates cultripes]
MVETLWLLVVHPHTQKFFNSFGDLSDPSSNAKVQAHGKEVLGTLNNASHHLDDMKGTLHQLSDDHTNILNMDPEIFKRFTKMLVIVMATKVGPAFTPPVHVALDKFLDSVADILIQRYP